MLRTSGGEKCRLACKVFHESRDKAIAWRAAQASANSEVFTKHETQITNHGFFQTRNTAFPVARMVLVGTEALQSCFFRSGMLGIRREEPFLRSRDAKIRGANVSNEKG